jgi:uncharacterized protein (DUF2235 family)
MTGYGTRGGAGRPRQAACPGANSAAIGQQVTRVIQGIDTRKTPGGTNMPRKGGFRHLIYFIDGTWLWAGSDNTLDVYSNIYRLNTLLNADDENGRAQIVHYSRGLGAVRGIRQYTAGGFAYGIDELVADLYVNVCSNYERGDKIYIFGFSRGAVVARALTGLISHGILKDHNINLFAHVWAAYAGQGEIMLPGQPRTTLSKSSEANVKEPLDYKAYCSEQDPQIEFVGVFDTVAGGHGLAEVAQKLRLSTQKVPPNVKHAVQLLAIDETRSFFRPIFWTGVSERTASRKQKFSTLEQIWMPGVHSDVGGAYRARHLGNLALLTMIDRVIARTSLSFDLKKCQELKVFSESGEFVRIHNELTKTWRLISASQARQLDTDIPQSIHPFAKCLVGQPVSFKHVKPQTLYALPVGLSALPIAKEFISGRFKSNCSLIPTAPPVNSQVIRL